MRRLMLLDDEPNVLSALERAVRSRFSRDELRVESFQDGAAALARARAMAFDAAISDYRMPTMSGVAFLGLLRSVQPDVVRIILSASRDFDAIQRAVNEAETFRYLSKPWSANEIETVVRAAFARRDEVLEERRLADEVRAVRGVFSREELERRRLEEEEPGITRVNWGPDGSVILDEE
jgi:DNA-binding NtrC family response regulator